MSKNISLREQQELFDKGLVIRRAWIMPGSYWEYYVSEIGVLRKTIAIRMSMRAAYNAAKRWLDAQHPLQPTGGTAPSENVSQPTPGG